MNAESFQAERGRLFGLAYRMLGSSAEAEDVVQDAWLRWSEAPRDDVASPRAFLGSIVTRLCLDRMKSARARREAYVGPWLPEPLRTPAADGADRGTLSIAFLLLLERLSPVERAAYLLHEVFDYSHDEIAEILSTNVPACRQTVHRARERLAGRRRFAATREDHERLLAGFLHACATGDVAGLERLLAHDATITSDGGGVAKAALKQVRGANRVARFVIGVLRHAPPDVSTEIAEVNGVPAIVARHRGVITDVLVIDGDDRISHIYLVRNPTKLARL